MGRGQITHTIATLTHTYYQGPLVPVLRRGSCCKPWPYRLKWTWGQAPVPPSSGTLATEAVRLLRVLDPLLLAHLGRRARCLLFIHPPTLLGVCSEKAWLHGPLSCTTPSPALCFGFPVTLKQSGCPSTPLPLPYCPTWGYVHLCAPKE